jgi:glycosyltransferase involved in cell wall biosynthesis
VDGETGYLVPRGDVGALKDRLERLLGDPDLRKRMGLAGRTRYERHFTVELMLRGTWEVYREVLGARGKQLPTWEELSRGLASVSQHC